MKPLLLLLLLVTVASAAVVVVQDGAAAAPQDTAPKAAIAGVLNVQAFGAKGDGEQAWIAAHKLKALANLVGAHALTEACEAMRGIDCQPSGEAIIDGGKWLQRLRSASQAACAALEAADEM